MELRFIIKTHTEGLRPGLLSLIIEHCTSPDRSAYQEQVIKKAAQILESVSQKRRAAVAFAVLAAWKHFGFLNEHMTWAWRAWAIHGVLAQAGRDRPTDPLKFFDLTLEERILYSKYFLEADGAIILEFSRLIGRRGVSTRELYEQMEQIVKGLYSSYLATGEDFRDKIIIKGRLAEVRKQMKGEGYAKSTLPHKVLPHLQAMEDLGLIRHEDVDSETRYIPAANGEGTSTDAIVTRIGDIQRLERICTQGNPFELIAEMLGITCRHFQLERDGGLLTSVIMKGYSFLRGTSTGLASIASLADWASTIMLAKHNIVASPHEATNQLDIMWHKDPAAVRFHVDHSGRKAYVVIDQGH